MSNYSSSEFSDDPNTPWYKVLSFVPRGSKVLDFGCSSGNFAKVLIDKKECEVDGVELNLEDAARARQVIENVYTVNVEQGGTHFLDGKKYDVIYFGDVIEHLIDPVQVLKSLSNHLATGGGIVFSIPNMAHMSVRLMLLKGEFEYGETGLLDKTHLHFYDKKEVERVFAEAGYQISRLDYVKRDIPRDVLAWELKKLGLKPSRKFLDASKAVEASAYQFVGTAQPTDTIPVRSRPSLSPPINEMERHIRYLKKVHKAQLNAHRTRIEELEVSNDRLLQELNSLKNEWAQLNGSPLVKVARRISKNK